ncbi:MAG TPA: copper resistance system multicopper oxidase [Oligoflexia bacterium]|nr:copper resistance system multicopper oxidase [Oligoflexia bacterium]
MTEYMISRRKFLYSAGAFGLYSALSHPIPAWAASGSDVKRSDRKNLPIDLTIDNYPFVVNGRTGNAIAINGTVPGPLIRLKEGEDAVIRVTNKLDEITSIHWHGILLPPEMDGVPGVSFAGISPGETFVYKFPVQQSGTYWCHSHAGGQELLGVYAPMIIDPKEPDPFHFDRDYVVMLSDWSFESPMEIMGNLKNYAGYYNHQMRTVGDLVDDIKKYGFSAAVDERMMWGNMNMDPTDIADVTGSTYSYLLNGVPSAENWTGLFRPGERVRLRFIDAAAMTLFDVRIPGLKMKLVQADGQNIEPIEVDEFRIGPGETYDVIIEPKDDDAYTIFSEASDRSGWVAGTIARQQGLKAPIPERRIRPIRTMEDMGMEMSGMENMSDMDTSNGMNAPSLGHQMPRAHDDPTSEGSMKSSVTSVHSANAMQMGGGEMDKMKMDSKVPAVTTIKHGPDHHGIGNSSVAEFYKSRLSEPGIGLGDSGRKVLVYTDLKSLVPGDDKRIPEREVELHLTGNMERYMWSFDGKKYSEAKTPIAFKYGERLRLVLVNDTMMEHTIHLHGMWMELENGNGAYNPRKHTILIKPAERLSAAITADAVGKWAFHCHLLLHMEMGMFRVVEVLDSEKGRQV